MITVKHAGAPSVLDAYAAPRIKRDCERFLVVPQAVLSAPAMERTLPRYFFHTQTDTRTTDEDGLELAGPVDARLEAIRTCGEIMRHAADAFWGSRPWSVTVTDAAGLVLWEIYVDGVSSAATSGIT
jgi:hypothetical protein